MFDRISMRLGILGRPTILALSVLRMIYQSTDFAKYTLRNFEIAYAQFANF